MLLLLANKLWSLSKSCMARRNGLLELLLVVGNLRCYSSDVLRLLRRNETFISWAKHAPRILLEDWLVKSIPLVGGRHVTNGVGVGFMAGSHLTGSHLM